MTQVKEEKKQIRILVAAAPESKGPITTALGNAFALSHCSSMVEARTALQSEFDMIACGLQFDDSRMFDLLRLAKADSATRTVPFLCVKATAGAFAPTLRQSIEIASTALGADGYVDLWEWVQEHGMEGAQARLHKMIRHITELRA